MPNLEIPFSAEELLDFEERDLAQCTRYDLVYMLNELHGLEGRQVDFTLANYAHSSRAQMLGFFRTMRTRILNARATH